MGTVMQSMHATHGQEIVASFIHFSSRWLVRLGFLHDLRWALRFPQTVTTEALMAITAGRSSMRKENGGPWISAKATNTRRSPHTTLGVIPLTVSNLAGAVISWSNPCPIQGLLTS